MFFNFACGYVAGVFCAVVSHPTDNLVSFLNNAEGATVGDISCEEAWNVGLVHPWAASPNCHDWYFDGSAMGNL
ncbi:uncharacterized protein A4U43_C01F8430 [Asparagus officinalis]|uniref:Uncharacterized protein n=1 Tax=Asparagus officinalis TaxID=4686 RepID=A0A5P1FSK0_ASPOF|nr:uncharacterized protein A4U43_C01F8430 [Asparagus officinalis]